jgi:hypothetical protein
MGMEGQVNLSIRGLFPPVNLGGSGDLRRTIRTKVPILLQAILLGESEGLSFMSIVAGMSR